MECKVFIGGMGRGRLLAECENKIFGIVLENIDNV